MEWYRRSRERWRTEQAIARQFLTDVSVGFDEEGRAFIRGTFTPVFEHGRELGNYKVRIVYPRNFLEKTISRDARTYGELEHRRKAHQGHPSVYLESHRDKWNNGGDSHIEDDWRLCLYVPIESEIDFRSDESLKELLLCLATFLFKEEVYQRALIIQTINGKPAVWPGTARSHGAKGIFEALQENQNGEWSGLCLCGSGEEFVECCLRRIIK